MHADNEVGGARTPRELYAELATHPPRPSRYRARGEIAQGGMGSIEEVWDGDLRRSLARKTIRGAGEARPDDELLVRFVEEAQVTAQLDHPGVVPVHELGVDSRGVLFFTMPRIRGGDLRGVLAKVAEERDGWSRTRALEVLLKVCETLAFAHSKGVVHRDVKPANIMVGAFGEVYVMDWGVAKVLGEEGARSEAAVTTDRAEVTLEEGMHTQVGSVVGTPAYMSPEQARGEVDELDARSDVYSVGAMLYELLCGWAPYSAPGTQPSASRTLTAVLEGPPEPLTKAATDAPPELVAIAERAMARDREDRYADTMDMARDLRAFMESRVVRAYRTGPVVELKKWVARNRATAAALLGVLVVIVSSLGTVGWVEAQGRERAVRDLGRIRGLSDVKLIRELKEREPSLWPPLPSRADDLGGWLREARAVHANLDMHEETRRRLEAAASSEASGGARLHFDDPFDRWQYEEVLALINETLLLPELMDDVGQRLAFAERVEAETVTGEGPARRWAECIEDIRQRPVYGGLDLRPQLGLLPLGRDRHSGLWEFAHLQSGALPEWDEDEGRVVRSEDMGIVLVLLPGGEAHVGAWTPSSEHPRGDPFVDPYKLRQDDDEEPVQAVRLDPFFIGKYELTRHQWSRVSGPLANEPFGPGFEVGPDSPALLVSWTASDLTLRRMDLELPTEAQWEYACRAGTNTPFFTGEDPASLQDFANVADQALLRARVNNGGQVSRDIDDGHGLVAPVGSFLPNEFGLHDMHGNVWEWCSDLFEEQGELRDGRGARAVGPEAINRSFRGGSWFGAGTNARSSNRFSWPPESRESDVGLRAARRVDADV